MVQGRGRLWLDGETQDVGPGFHVAFPAGTGVAHCLINDSHAKDDLVLLAYGQVCGSHDYRTRNGLLIYFHVGEQDLDEDQIYYPLGGDAERESVTAAARVWWEDAPRRTLGPVLPLPLP